MIKEILLGLLFSGTTYSQFREIEYVDSLKINTENIKRYISIKNEKSGLIDLQKLANESYYEEAFLYHDSVWTELGHGETGWIYEKDSMRVTKVTADSTVYSVSDSLENAVLYHIHHLKGHPDSESKDILKVNALKIELILPSNKDILNAIAFPKITHKIASPLGITTIGFYQIPKTTNRMMALLEIALKDIKNNSIQNDDECIEHIHTIIESWNGNNSTFLEFTPYRALGVR
ncbi:MAG: hypothetical protein ACP5NV_01355 [Candidatus Woesearchaeota archaeon]